MFCPNFLNKEVFDGFNEMVEALGGKALTEDEFRSSELRNQRTGDDYVAMETAYQVYHRNNGEFVDIAPNGKKSILFDKLMLSSGQDRKSAIKQKCLMYTDAFFKKNGDWLNNQSKLDLDVNGEPVIDYKVENINPFGITNPYALFGENIQQRLLEGDMVSSRQIVPQILSKHVIDPFTEQMALILQAHDIMVTYTDSLNSYRLASYVYKDGKGYIQLNRNLLNKVSPQYTAQVIIHEMSHAMLSNALNNPKTPQERELKKNTIRLLNAYREYMQKHPYLYTQTHNGLYAMTNEHEFLAEFMSNPLARDTFAELAKIIDKQNNKGLLGFFRNLVNSIVKIFTGDVLFKPNNQQQLEQYRSNLIKYLQNVPTTKVTDIEQIKHLREQYEGTPLIVKQTQDKIEQAQYARRQMLGFIEYYKGFDNKGNSYTSLNQNIQDAISDLNVRINSLKHQSMDQIEKTNLINATMAQLESLKNPNISQLDAIGNIVTQISHQIREDLQKLIKVADGELPMLTDSEYMYHMHSNFGMYLNTIKSFSALLNNNYSRDELYDAVNKMPVKISREKFNEAVKDISRRIQALTSALTEGSTILDSIRNVKVYNSLKSISEEVGSIDGLEYAKSFVSDTSKVYDDISFIAASLQPTDSVNNEAIRALNYVITKARNKTEKLSREKVEYLLQLQKKLKLGENVFQIYEIDEKGRPTQYIVRSVKFGQYYQDRNNYRDKVKKDIRKKIDKGLLSADEAESEYSRLMNEFLRTHCERKMVSEWYDIWNSVPIIAKESLQSINNAINELYERSGAYVITKDNKGNDIRRYDVNKLNYEQYQELQRLQIEKKLLYSEYDRYGIKKDGIALQIAQSLTKLNEDLKKLREEKSGKKSTNDILESEYDMAGWRSAFDQVIEECGGKEAFDKWFKGDNLSGFNVSKFRKWQVRNARLQFKQNEDGVSMLFSEIDQAVGSDIYYGDEYERIKEQINDLLAPHRDTNGDVIITSITDAKLAEINKLYHKQSKAKKAYIKKIGGKELQKLSKEKQKAISRLLRETDNPYILELRRKLAAEYAQEFGVDNILGTGIEEYINSQLLKYGNLYQNSQSILGGNFEVRLYNYAKKRLARDMSTYMEFVPTFNWKISEDDSALRNPNFNADYGVAEVPKAFDKNGNKLYDNSKAYERVTRDGTALNNMYNAVIQTMRESNQLYTNKQFADPYLLPGITGDVIDRYSNTKGFWKKLLSFFVHLGDKFGLGRSENDRNEIYGITDEEQNEDQFEDNQVIISGKYPDGRSFNTLPHLFTKRLRNTERISRDLVTIVGVYYASAVKYSEFNKIQDTCETIIDGIEHQSFSRRDIVSIHGTPIGKKILIGGRTKVASNVLTTAQKLLEMHMYGKSTKKMKIGGDKFQFDFSQFALELRNVTTAVNLGMNPKVAHVGFLTSQFAHWMNAATGQKYTIGDLIRGWTDVLLNVSKLVLNTFFDYKNYQNDLRRNKMWLLAEYTNITDLGTKKGRYANRNIILRTILENSVFGLLSQSDFLSKASIMMAEARNYRYVDGKFLRRDDIRQMRAKLGEEGFEQMMSKWSKAESLYSCLEVTKDGKLAIKAKYKEAFDENTQNIFKNDVETTCEEADGMLTAMQKAALSQNILFNIIMIHRNYLIPMFNRYFGEQVYDYNTRQYKNGEFRTLFKFVLELSQNNLMAGMASGAFTGASFGGGLGAVIGAAVGASIYSYNRFKNGKSQKSLKQILNENFNTFDTDKNAAMSYYRRYQLYHVAATVFAYQFLISPLVGLIASLADEDDDNLFWLQYLAYISRATQWETYTPFRGDDLLNNVRSATAMESILDVADLLSSSMFGHKEIAWNINWLLELLLTQDKENQEDGKVIDDGDTIIKRGSYKGYPKWFRTILKSTSARNIFEQYTNSKAKRQYLENKIMGIKEPKE